MGSILKAEGPRPASGGKTWMYGSHSSPFPLSSLRLMLKTLHRDLNASFYSLFTSPTRTRQDCLVLSVSAVWTQLQDSFVLSWPSFDEFCLVSVQFPIFKFSVILNIFETEQLQIGNSVETRQNCLVLSPVEFTLSRTRGHPFKLYKHFTSCSVRSSFFSERVINCWNRLPIDTVDFSSLAKFIRSIDTVITTVFIRDT